MHLSAELLDHYVRGELTKAEFEEVMDHLSTCRDCADLAGFELTLFRTLGAKRGSYVQPRTPTCPSEKTLLDYAAGALREPEKAALASHIATCTYCAAELPTVDEVHEFEMYLQERQTSVGGTSGLNSRPFKSIGPTLTEWFSSNWKVAALATAALAVLVVVMTRLPLTLPQAEVSRSERNHGESVGVILIQPAEGSVTVPFMFRWQPVENATSYRIVVTGRDNPLESMALWIESTFVTSERLPDLKSGQSYDWQVQAYIGERALGESELRQINVKQ